MTRRLAAIVALSALSAACDDKLLAEGAAAAGHDVTASVTETEDGKLSVQIHNGRDERISEPRAALWLFMVEGVPTLDLGPRELYKPDGYDRELPCGKDVAGIDPGGAWLVEAEIPHEQAAGVGRNNYASRARHDKATLFDSLRLRVWVFPHRGVVNNCMGQFQKLPDIFIDAKPSEEVVSWSRSRRASFRAFAPAEEPGVFYEAPSTADQSTLYFIETDLKLKRPFKVFLLAEEPSTGE